MKSFGGVLGACFLASGCHASVAESPLAPPTATEPPESGIVCSSADVESGIRRVIVRGASDRSPCARLRSIAGRAEDGRVVESDIEALFASATYADVVVVREVEEHGVDLVFEVEERPRIRGVSVDGATSEPAEAALADFELETPERVDPAWLRRSELRLTEALVDGGFSRATVQAAVQRRDPTREASVRFVIDEGPRTLLTRLDIRGLHVASEKVVREKLYLRTGAPAPPSLIERDELLVAVALYDLGLLESKVEKQVITSADGTGVDVSFHVKEGPVHLLRKVAVSGDARLDPKQYAPLLGKLKKGAAFSRSAVLDVKTKLEEMHTAASLPADIELKIDVAPGSTDVSVTFEVTPR